MHVNEPGQQRRSRKIDDLRILGNGQAWTHCSNAIIPYEHVPADMARFIFGCEHGVGAQQNQCFGDRGVCIREQKREHGGEHSPRVSRSRAARVSRARVSGAPAIPHLPLPRNRCLAWNAAHDALSPMDGCIMLSSMIVQEHLIALCRRVDPQATILRTEKMTGGVSAEVQRVTLATRDGRTRELVVRSHREFSGKSDPALRAEREYRLLARLAATDQPIPRPCAYDPPFTLLLEWVEGSSAMPAAPAEPLAALIAGVHESGVTVVDEPFVDPLPMLREWLPSMTIPQTLPALSNAHLTLVHGDFWPGNVLWHHGAVAALIDWEDASMGDCLIDVASMRAELYRLTNRQTVDEFTRAYAGRRGIDEGRLAWWDLFMASAQLMYMDSWGLAPEELQQRGNAMSRWQQDALTALGQGH